MAVNDDVLRLRDRRPLYVQAIDALTEMIENGSLHAGEQLPPEDELASRLGISRSTLREAMSHLETHGLIARKQGIGTFVTIPAGPGFFGGLERLEPFRDLAEAAGVKHSRVERIVTPILASPEMANILNVSKGTKLLRVETIEAIDEIRCMYFDDYFLSDDRLAAYLEEEAKSVLIYMFEECSPPLSHTRSEIFAVEASSEVAEKLDIAVGKPVFHMEETYFAATGEILGVGFIYFVTDRFRFYVTRRAVRS